ncbi:MAG: (Fe-S)-binding protein [Chloroflexia bacterium]|nr:(Fe-S)-binding protein [Chloroflexia bacterium]
MSEKEIQSKPFPQGALPDEAQIQSCIRCGLCSAVCPIYQETRMETDAPRGRIALVRAVLEGRLEPSPRFKKIVYQCLACQACVDICPAGVRTDQLMMAARAYLLELEGRHWFRNMLFGWLLPKPARLEKATMPLRCYERLGLRRLVDRAGLDRLLPRRLREMSWLLPPIPRRPLRPQLERVTPAYNGSAGQEPRCRIGYFLGCAQDVMFASASAATVRVLTRNGCEVYTPAVTCCGMPHLGYGELERAKDLARQNIDAFTGQDLQAVITDCASCASTLHEYGELLADDPAYAEKARAFSERVRDISQFLDEIGIEPPQGRLDVRVTYHDPCHLVRGMGVSAAPRRLLQSIPGLELVEMEEANWCCGNAGSHAITETEESGRLLDRKMAHVADTDAQLVASGCPGCQLQLWRGVRRWNLPMQVVHPIELLDQAYRNGEKTNKR